jgi:hypothetical protein
MGNAASWCLCPTRVGACVQHEFVSQHGQRYRQHIIWHTWGVVLGCVRCCVVLGKEHYGKGP